MFAPPVPRLKSAAFSAARHGQPVGPRLRIGPVNDRAEREADRAAESAHSNRPLTASTQDGSAQSLAPRSVHDALRSPGRPLDATTRAYYEPRLGKDLADVRVHTGDVARQSAREVDALAYTVGSHIVFGAGRSDLATSTGRRLLAHELGHVARQPPGAPVLRRAPDSQPKKLEQFVPANQVVDLYRGPGEEWRGEWIIVLSGHVSPESAGRALWPQRVPLGVAIDLQVAVIDPIDQGTFKITGIDDRTIKLMEPSIAALFKARLADEASVEAKIDAARAAFRKRHSDLGEWKLRTLDFALKKATKGNPDLRLAFYRHYASAGFDEMDSDTELGETSSGDTDINEKALLLESRFKTDDPVALLAGTLIHEFVHTPQGGKDHAVASAPKEGKAYGIEVFFAERMGDEARQDVIYKRYRGTDPIDQKMGGDKIFLQSYYIMTQLYKIVDSDGGPAGAKARAMSVEFISKNANDFGPDLRAFIAKHLPEGYVAM
jgi:hypothetical protein